MSLSPDLSRLVVLVTNGIYDVRLPLRQNLATFHPIATTTSFWQFQVSVAPNSQYAYIGDPDRVGIIRVPLPFSTPTFIDFSSRFPSTFRVTDIVFHPSGSYAYAAFWSSGANATNYLAVVNTASGALTTSPAADSCVNYGGLAISPQGDYLMSGCVFNATKDFRPFRITGGGATLTPDTPTPMRAVDFEIFRPVNFAIPIIGTARNPGGLVLRNISPDSAPPGSPAQTLRAVGLNFDDTAVVRWTSPTGQVTALSPALRTRALLEATIPASLLTTTGTAQVAIVNNPGPGETVSNSLPFTLADPNTPVLRNITPNLARAGASDRQLIAQGSNFQNGAVVQWTTPSGQQRPLSTGFRSASILTATIPGSLLTTPGTAQVAVENPGGRVSATSLPFTISP
jgi:hypothetical protein